MFANSSARNSHSSHSATDFRTNSDELGFLEQKIHQVALGREWQEWASVLSPELDPSSVFFVALRSRGVFELLDSWRQSRHCELCDFIRSTVLEHKLAGMMSPTVTAQGAPVGEHYQRSRLAGAFGTQRLRANQPIVDLGLALVFLSVLKNPIAREKHWIEELCGASHNNAGENWQTVLPVLPMPTVTWELRTVLEWACSYSRQQKITHSNTETRFRSAISQAGIFLSHKSSHQISGHSTNEWVSFKTITLRPPPPEPDTAPTPEVIARPVEVIFQGNEATLEADVPEITLVSIDEALPPDEPDRSEAFTSSAAIRTSFRSAFDNQRLRYHWDALFPLETQALIRAIDADINAIDPERSIPALVIGLALCLGMRPNQVTMLTLSKSGHPGLDSMRGLFVKTVPRPPQSWQMAPERPCELQEPANTISFPLPKAIAKALRKWARMGTISQPLGNALQNSVACINTLTGQWLTKARAGRLRLRKRQHAN